MNLKIKYILPIFAFIPTQTYAFAPETPDEVTSVSADTVKIKGEGEVNYEEEISWFDVKWYAGIVISSLWRR